MVYEVKNVGPDGIREGYRWGWGGSWGGVVGEDSHISGFVLAVMMVPPPLPPLGPLLSFPLTLGSDLMCTGHSGQIAASARPALPSGSCTPTHHYYFVTGAMAGAGLHLWLSSCPTSSPDRSDTPSIRCLNAQISQLCLCTDHGILCCIIFVQLVVTLRELTRRSLRSPLV